MSGILEIAEQMQNIVQNAVVSPLLEVLGATGFPRVEGNPEDLTQHLRAAVEYSDDLPPSVSGLSVKLDGVPCIVINRRKHRSHQHVTMAHESVHLLLHFGDPSHLDKQVAEFQAQFISLFMVTRTVSRERFIELCNHNPDGVSAMLVALLLSLMTAFTMILATLEKWIANDEHARLMDPTDLSIAWGLSHRTGLRHLFVRQSRRVSKLPGYVKANSMLGCPRNSAHRRRRHQFPGTWFPWTDLGVLSIFGRSRRQTRSQTQTSAKLLTLKLPSQQN